MKAFGELSVDTLSQVRGIATDLDDTLTTEGMLTPAALDALFALERAGVPCVVATGRPVGWAEVIARLLPVRAVVAENGGAWALREGHAVRVAFVQSETERTEGMVRARAMAVLLEESHPGLERVPDWTVRATDVTLDVGERASVPRNVIDQCLATIAEGGLHGVASTVHLHIGARAPDKMDGLRHALTDLGLSPEELGTQWVYVGDSPNDEGPFGAIALSVGVAGVRRFTLRRPPKYITVGSAGEGFAEVVRAVLGARVKSPRGA